MEFTAPKIRGNKPWLAKLTGLDNKFGFSREFIRKRKIIANNSPYEEYSLKTVGPGWYQLSVPEPPDGKPDKAFFELAVMDEGEEVLTWKTEQETKKYFS